MPRRDGTGPMGLGYANGRCFGFCTGANAARYGSEFSTKTHKELLQEQKDLLKMRLDAIDKQLENLYRASEVTGGRSGSFCLELR